MRRVQFTGPREGNIRIWRRIPTEEYPYSDWHVSVGAEAPFQRLYQLTDAPRRRKDLGGMAWDEALEVVSLSMISPGALRPLLRHLEPPLDGGWDLVVEIAPLGGAEFNVFGTCRRWDRLTLGEALATFVRLTFNVDWSGFGSDNCDSFALVRVAS